MATGAVRVLTVDDQAIFRGVARAVIDATPSFEAVGEAESGVEALAAVERLAPDVVVLDVRMPGLDGVEVARRLGASHPGTLVVLVSVEDAADLPSAARARRAACRSCASRTSGRGCSRASGASTRRAVRPSAVRVLDEDDAATAAFSARAPPWCSPSALGLCAIAVAVTLSGSSRDESGAEALARALMVVAPFAVGVYALRRPPFERFGKLLIVTGVALVPDDARRLGRRGALQPRAGRGLDGRAAARSTSCSRSRPAGSSSRRRPRDRRSRPCSSWPSSTCRRRCSSSSYPTPAPWTTCDERLPAQRVHGRRLGAGGRSTTSSGPLREALT